MTLLASRLFCPFVVFFFLLLPSHPYFSFLFSSPFLVLPPCISVLPTFRLLLFLFLKHGEGIMSCGDPMSPTMSPTSFFFLSFSGSLLLSHPDLFSSSLVFSFFFFLSPLSFFVSFSLLFIFFFSAFCYPFDSTLQNPFFGSPKKTSTSTMF